MNSNDDGKERPATPPFPRRGGRPKLAPEAVRGRLVAVRFSEAEWTTLKARAAERGVGATTLLREAGLGHRLPSLAAASPPTLEALRELRAIGRNLNQAVALAHAAGQSLREQEIRALRDDYARLAVSLTR